MFAVIYQLGADSKTLPVAGQNESTDSENDYIGTYEGLLPGYHLLDQNGIEILIAGNRVPVPSSTFRFTLKSDFSVDLQQTDEESRTIIDYTGSYKLIEEDSQQVTIHVQVSDGEYSFPEFKLIISREDFSGICIGSNQPTFNIRKLPGV